MLRRLVLWFVVVPLALPVLVLVFQHFRGRSMLAAEIARLHAAGETFDIAQLAPPLVPAASNGMPAFMAARRKFAALEKLPAPSWFEPFSPGVAIVPTRMESWGEGAQGTNTWAAVELSMMKLESAFDDLHAALALPYRREERDWSKGFSMLVPALATMKGATVMLGLAALSAAQRGDFTYALAELEAARVLDSDLAPDPLLISQLVRIACASIANSRTWGVLHAQDWSEDQLRALQASLRATNLVEGVVHSLRGERALVLQEFRAKSSSQIAPMLDELGSGMNALFGPPTAPMQMPDSLDSAVETAGTAVQRLGEGVRTKIIFPLWYFAWGEQSLATYLGVMNEWIAMQQEAGRQHSYKMVVDFNLDARIAPGGFGERLRGVLPRMLIPALGRASAKAFRAETESALHQTAIALRRHQLRHGRLPERLDQLVPDFLGQVPIDGMDGQPLRYRRDSDSRFSLWSVGEDLVDNGGDPDWPDALKSRTHWWMGRDAVWPRAAGDAEFATWRKAQAEKEAVRRKPGRNATTPSRWSPEVMKRYGIILPTPASTNTGANPTPAP